MASIEDIVAVSYDYCGLVRMVSSSQKETVALTHGPDNVKPQKKQTDGNGNFCFEVIPGSGQCPRCCGLQGRMRSICICDYCEVDLR